jgi:hypothetical protein
MSHLAEDSLHVPWLIESREQTTAIEPTLFLTGRGIVSPPLGARPTRVAAGVARLVSYR